MIGAKRRVKRRYDYDGVPTSNHHNLIVRALAVRANHLFSRFRTGFRVPYAIRPCYESCVRAEYPFDLVLARVLVSVNVFCPRKLFS
jgi:hypothetical protein